MVLPQEEEGEEMFCEFTIEVTRVHENGAMYMCG